MGTSMYGNNQWDIGTLILKLWLLNSVGSECFPYKEEVVGSNPTEATVYKSLVYGVRWVKAYLSIRLVTL